MRQDLIVAARRSARHPGLFGAIVFVVSMSVGANTTVFSLLLSVVIRPLSLNEPERLVRLSQVNSFGQLRPIPLASVNGFKSQQTAFEAVSAYIGGVLFTTESPGGVKSSGIEFVDGDYYSLLGTSPYLGRLISPSDADAAAVLGHAFWQRYFAGNPAVIGTQFRIEGRPFTIIGVTPPEHTGLRRDTAPDAVVPVGQLGTVMASAASQPRANYLVGRLKRGISIEQARDLVGAMWPSIASDISGQSPSPLRPVVEPIGFGFSQLRDRYSAALTVLSILAAAMWVLACANIAALTLAHATERVPELNLRMALGASRVRVCRQMLVESALPTVVGIVLAIPVASWAAAAIARLMWNGLSALTLDVSPDWKLIVVVSLASLASAALFGMIPLAVVGRGTSAFAAPRVVSRARLGKALQVVQVAISVALIVSAAQLARGFYELQSSDLGFRSGHVLLARLAGLPTGYRGIDEATYYPELLQQLSELPSVVSVSMSDTFPSVSDESVALKPINAEGSTVRGLVEVISPGFFGVVGIPRLTGRDFTWFDTVKTSPVAILNESAARKLFGRTDAVGRRVTLGADRASITAEVVGVVADSSFGNPRSTHVPAAFRPALQEPALARSPWLEIKTKADPVSVAGDVQRVVGGLGREFARDIRSLDAHVAGMIARETVSSALAVVFAVTGATVAFVGLHGLLSYLTTRQRREFGVRIALGAAPGAIATRVMRQAFALTVGGLILSIPLCLWVSRVLAPTAPPSIMFFVAAVVACAVLGITASLLPALRATRADPIEILRVE